MRDFFSLHPATRVLLWIALAVFAFSSDHRELLLLTAALALPLFFQGFGLFFGMLSRIRWILVSLLTIYAFETPGTALFPLGDFSPTIEGLVSGATQAWRILIAIALLAILQGATSREQILSGIYTLLQPLKRWIDVERIAVRLLLTLHYADEKRQGDWRERLLDAFREREYAQVTLRLELHRFRARDGAALLALAAAMML